MNPSVSEKPCLREGLGIQLSGCWDLLLYRRTCFRSWCLAEQKEPYLKYLSRDMFSVLVIFRVTTVHMFTVNKH